jgi:hypothetical protein
MPRMNAVDHPQGDEWCDGERVTRTSGSREHNTVGAFGRGTSSATTSQGRFIGGRSTTGCLRRSKPQVSGEPTEARGPTATAEQLGHTTKQRHYSPAYNGNAAESTFSLSPLLNEESRRPVRGLFPRRSVDMVVTYHSTGRPAAIQSRAHG